MGISQPYEETLELVETPEKSDVLCGKNKECLEHPGSVAFRHVIEDFVERYQAADSKYMKMEITKEIYRLLGEQSSRFLKYNSKLGVWQELSSSTCRDKIGHSLRFAIKRRRSGRSKHRSGKKMARHRRMNSEVSSSSEYGSSSSSSRSTSSDSTGSLETSESLVRGKSPVQGILDAAKTKSLHTTGGNIPTTSFPGDEYRPVTNILRGLSQRIPQIPRSVSFTLDVSLSPVTESRCNRVSGRLSDKDVLNIMQAPLMEFEPQSVKAVYD